ncbi:MAG: universal stress protein [Gemmatimonadetes bacterium]|nr:universal stress protein [Gemmatimonadota bacterium]
MAGERGRRIPAPYAQAGPAGAARRGRRRARPPSGPGFRADDDPAGRHRAVGARARPRRVLRCALLSAAFRLVRVVPFPIQFTSPYLPHTMQMNQQFVSESRDAAAAYLETHAERLRARGRTVETSVVVVAQAGHGLLTEVAEAHCDLVAMATHGRAGLTRAILGSTADKVVRGVHVPILLYRPAE